MVTNGHPLSGDLHGENWIAVERVDDAIHLTVDLYEAPIITAYLTADDAEWLKAEIDKLLNSSIPTAARSGEGEG